MSLGGTSPTTTSQETDGPVSNKDFGKYIKYFQDTHSIIRKWDHVLHNAPAAGVTIMTPDGEKVMDKRSLARYSRDFVNQLGDLKKIYTNRKRKRKTNQNSEFSSLFYVSDQIVAFYTKANLGPIDPESGDGELSSMVDIVTKNRMANSGILTSLFSRYISANNLATDEGRFAPDDRMKKAFNTTNFRMFSKDLSKRKCVAGTTPEKEADIKLKVSLGKKSAFDRAYEKINKRGDRMYEPEKGLLWTSMMTINSYYRIPSQILTDSEREALKEPENVQAAKDLQEITTHIKNQLKQIKDAAK